MNRATRLLCLLCLPLAGIPCLGQTTARLETADTKLEFAAGEHAPQLVRMGGAGGPWENRAPETLIASVEVDGQAVPLTWTLVPSKTAVSRERVSFTYESASPKLRLTWLWEVRSARGPAEHEIRIENLDTREMWLPMQDSFRFDWATPASGKLTHFFVEKGADSPSASGTHIADANDGYAWQGFSSTYAYPNAGEWREIIPYSLVYRDQPGEPGWYVGIEFSGRTRIAVARLADSLHGAAGLNPNPGPFRTRLAPGGSFETPRIFLGASTGGPDGAANVLRPWVREVLGNPTAWKDPAYPLVVNNSWGGGMQVNDTIARRMIAESAELGVDLFGIDAGWFRGVGDWHPNPAKFPDGLGVIADEAHRRGLRIGMWVDWTQAALGTEPGSLNVRDPKVKGWLTNDPPPEWKPEEFKGQTIDLGVPEAKAWAMQETNRIVTDYKIDMLEHDGYLVAQGCDATDHPHAPPDPQNRCIFRDGGSTFVRSTNATDVSYHAVRAYYDVQTNLHQKHPGLLLEVCNDGGRMVDFGSAAHGDYFSITDTYDPLSNRRAFYDTSFALPAAMLESYVERWPVPRIENFRYMLRSGMMGWLTIMLDTSAWDQEQHAAAKAEIALYKSQLRPLIRDAELYHVSLRPDGVRWDGMEYFDPRTRRGAVFAFRGTTPEEARHHFALRGLQAKARYQLHYHDHSSPDRVVSGGELMSSGLEVALPLPNSSEIVFLEELPAGK